MNAMQVLSSQPWVERLGWTLVHFLWQGLSIAVLYAVARRAAGRTSSPSARYLVACAALTAMLAAPLVTWVVKRPSDATTDAAYRKLSASADAATTRLANTVLRGAFGATVSTGGSAQFLPWVVIIWLFGAA